MHDARDRPRGGPTDPRQGDELGSAHGDLAAEPCHAVLGRLVQPARAPVVAKPLPLGQDLVLMCGRQGRGGRKASDEPIELLEDARDLRLLKHEFADERVVPRAAGAPRQVARGGGEPSFDARGKGCGPRRVCLSPRQPAAFRGRATSRTSPLRLGRAPLRRRFRCCSGGRSRQVSAYPWFPRAMTARGVVSQAGFPPPRVLAAPAAGR